MSSDRELESAMVTRSDVNRKDHSRSNISIRLSALLQRLKLSLRHGKSGSSPDTVGDINTLQSDITEMAATIESLNEKDRERTAEIERLRRKAVESTAKIQSLSQENQKLQSEKSASQLSAYMVGTNYTKFRDYLVEGLTEKVERLDSAKFLTDFEMINLGIDPASCPSADTISYIYNHNVGLKVDQFLHDFMVNTFTQPEMTPELAHSKLHEVTSAYDVIDESDPNDAKNRKYKLLMGSTVKADLSEAELKEIGGSIVLDNLPRGNRTLRSEYSRLRQSRSAVTG